MLQIRYGITDLNIDVTDICHSKLKKFNYIYIPKGDHNRAQYFTDPLINILKSVFIYNNKQIIREITDQEELFIDIITNELYTEMPDKFKELYLIPILKLKQIHSQLKLDFGTFDDEFPEQLMAVRYLTGKEKVLEIGGNIGRNSLVIAYILNMNNNNNFVSLESDSDIANQLTYNRNQNNLDFKIESSALSNRNLIQSGWTTMVSDIVLPSYKKVNTINYNDFKEKYNINFDTLVVDCEGALYYILMDMPQILDNIKLIIMENDYNDINHKNYIDEILKERDFKLDYVESGGWGPCFNNFFEVWKK
jgi:FkbM family methyltransferase